MSELITINVCTPPWSESRKSWYLLTKKSPKGNAWSEGFWFPKSKCKLDLDKGTLELPDWLCKSIMNRTKGR